MEQRYDVRGSKIGIEFVMNPIIKLSNNAASRIKEIMANAEKDSIGVRVSVKFWWLCRDVICNGIHKRVKS